MPAVKTAGFYRKMIVSITTEHVYRKDTSIFDQLNLLKEAGFRGVDFTACRYIGPEYKPGSTKLFSDDWKSWVKDIKAWSDGNGMTFTQNHNLTHNYFATEGNTELLNSMIDRVFEVCEILQIPVTVMHPAVPPGMSGDISGCLKVNAGFIKEKAKKAAEHNVKIAVENLVITRSFDQQPIWRICHTKEQVCELVDRINEPNVGICLDTGHAHYMHEDLYQAILQYSTKLFALHIHDNNQFFDYKLPPFLGTIDWDSVVRGLAKIHYQGAWNFETYRSTIDLPVNLQVGMLKEIYKIGEFLVSKISDKG